MGSTKIAASSNPRKCALAIACGAALLAAALSPPASAGATSNAVNVWNGNGQAMPGPPSNNPEFFDNFPGTPGGGGGIWTMTSPNWTNYALTVHGPMSPQPGVAGFYEFGGTVQVDNSAGKVTVTGINFISPINYSITGDPVALAANNGAMPIISVGNGLTIGVGYHVQIDSVLTGNAGLEKIDEGKLILTANNTYTGGTIIAGGTLKIGNGGTTGSVLGNININKYGELWIDRSDSFALSNTLSGVGSVTQAGTGTLTLTGNNSAYNGNIFIQSGALAVTDPTQVGSAGISLLGGALQLTGNFTLPTPIAVAESGQIDVASNSVVTFGHGLFAGANLLKTGAGTLTIAGQSYQDAPVEVAAGTLNITSDFGHTLNAPDGSPITGSYTITVDNGATLVADSNIQGVAVHSGGTLSPGIDGTGTIKITGDLSLSAGSTYNLAANASGQSGLVQVSGTASVQGSSVTVNAIGSSWMPSTHYTILSAKSINGAFGSVSSNLPLLSPALSYDANDVYLTLTPNIVEFESFAVTGNQNQTASALTASPNSLVYDALLPLTANQVRTAFTELTGDSLASAHAAILEDSYFVRNAINDHLLRTGSTGQIEQSDNDSSVWASLWGHDGNQDSDGNAARMRVNGSGLLVGADRNLDAWRIGAVVGSGELSSRNSGGEGDTHSTNKTFGLYAGTALDAWQFQGGVAHSWYTTRSHRYINVIGLQGATDANSSNGITQAYFDAGYRFMFSQGSLSPYTDLARVWMHQGAIRENGSAALNVQAADVGVNYGTLGLRGVYEPTANLQLHAAVGYQHAMGDLRTIDKQSFISGGNVDFTVAGLPVTKNASVVDLGVRFALSRRLDIEAGYHGQFSNHVTDSGARLSLNMKL
ncbi:autotransporter outer membrane beta-barrel domain-containing protein [Dyella choica]|nr:autotransporter domain-containing protein [Dyella choica]